MTKLILIYLLVINLIGFCLMGSDKQKARQHKWRIPEKAFFLVTLFGGGIGTWTGMYAFRHKTKHLQFILGIPAILIAEIFAVVYLLYFR